MSTTKLWLLSHCVSLVFLVTLSLMWSEMMRYEFSKDHQLLDDAATQRVLRNITSLDNDESLKQIKTGIFIQSLKFYNASEVNFTGYIWQHFPLDVYQGVDNADIEPGFVLPEQVATGSDISPRLSYRKPSQYGEVLGWYVEATLKQKFDYSHYPFDHKTVWIRLWAKDFSENVVLTPDFDAYDNTGIDSIFGIEKSIVLGAWNRENTFFDYKLSTYDTNFGISNYVGQQGFPELYYNFVIKRRFNDAFIVYLLPLFLISVLLYASLLIVSDRKRDFDLLGFSASGFLGMCSALFFVVMIAHINLREQFASSSIVYLEFYYLLAYVLLTMSTINIYLFSIRPEALKKIILYRDNLIPKVCYWPFILISLNVITLFYIR